MIQCRTLVHEDKVQCRRIQQNTLGYKSNQNICGSLGYMTEDLETVQITDILYRTVQSVSTTISSSKCQLSQTLPSAKCQYNHTQCQMSSVQQYPVPSVSTAIPSTKCQNSNTQYQVSVQQYPVPSVSTAIPSTKCQYCNTQYKVSEQQYPVQSVKIAIPSTKCHCSNTNNPLLVRPYTHYQVSCQKMKVCMRYKVELDHFSKPVFMPSFSTGIRGSLSSQAQTGREMSELCLPGLKNDEDGTK